MSDLDEAALAVLAGLEFTSEADRCQNQSCTAGRYGMSVSVSHRLVMTGPCGCQVASSLCRMCAAAESVRISRDQSTWFSCFRCDGRWWVRVRDVLRVIALQSEPIGGKS